MKKRIDALLFERGLVESRERAKTTVMAGLVLVDNQKVEKPGTKVDENADIKVKGKAIPFVSRGGLKLDKALKSFDIDLEDKVCLDIGASTGGFTDCMLQNGAKKVYSIDVGYGQLAWKLRNDDRVVCMERTNARKLKKEDIEDVADFASIDVSFISLKLIIPVAKELLREKARIVALIKPQFEAGRENVGKKGVVRDKSVHKQVIIDIAEFVQKIGFEFLGIDFSPVKGPEGNIEYLLYIEKNSNATPKNIDQTIAVLVDHSHEDLKK